MGREVVVRALDEGGVEIVGAFEAEGSPSFGRGLPELFGPEAPDVVVGALDRGVLVAADAAIDFSVPAGTLSLLPLAADAGTAVVIGTTGFNGGEEAAIRDASERIPILLAPNLSEGAGTLFSLLPDLIERAGEGWDIEVVECHHRGKVDAPSGTALRIAEILATARGARLEDVAVYGRRGRTGPRGAGEIGIHSLRTGGTPGEHTVRLGRGEEELILTHRIHGRGAFARGAIRAARWLAGRAPGLYAPVDLAGPGG
jgi:4-hydroxy-tetrahydrodipicolinate reductase